MGNIFFLDEKVSINQVVGMSTDRIKFKDHDFFIGGSFNKINIFFYYKKEEYSLPSIITPLSDISSAKVGNGIKITQCFINVDTIIEEGVIMIMQV